MLRLEGDAWSIVKGLRQARNEYAPPAEVAPLEVRPDGPPEAPLEDPAEGGRLFRFVRMYAFI